MLEREPIQRLVRKKQLAAFKHESFWYCMDNLRDKQILEKLNKQNYHLEITNEYIYLWWIRIFGKSISK